ncbi:MAG: hypothetical protein ACREDK_09085 [Thermoplasmata archaeon]
MEPEIHPNLVAVFGSETRVRVLAVLANAFRPLTAYRVAKVGGVSIPKAYRELERLEKAAVVVHRKNGFVLAETSRAVGDLIATKVRLSWDKDWEAEQIRERAEMESLLARLSRIPCRRPSKGFVPKHPELYRRSPTKDRILREMGLPTSIHAQ